MASRGAEFSALSVLLLFLTSHCCVSSYMNDCGVQLKAIDVSGPNSPLILQYQGQPQQHLLQMFHPSRLNTECLTRNFYVMDSGLADLSCLGHSLAFPGLRHWPDDVRATSLIASRQGGSFDNFTVVTPQHPAPIDLERMSGPITCAGRVEPTMRRLDDGKYQMGYQMNALDFLPIADLTIADRMTFAHARVLTINDRRPRIDGSEESLRKGPLFKDLPVDASKLGTKHQLSSKFKELLKSKPSAEHDTADDYLVHGQLLSKDDLFYIPEQRATFFLENTALIWSSINDGNWKMVGDIVRRLASETVTDLDVYPGTLECLTHNKTSIHEDNLKNSTKHDCVPKFLFKVALDNRYNSQRGIVFITVNDPTVRIASNGSIPNEFKLCDKKAECDQLYPEFLSPKKGYTYCCNLEDFEPWNEIQNSRVEELPDVMMPPYTLFGKVPPPPPPMPVMASRPVYVEN